MSSASRLPVRVLTGLAVVGTFATLMAQEVKKAEENVPAFQGHQETVYGVALGSDGKQLLTASFDKTVKLWDVATRQEVRTFGGPAGHQGLVLGVAFAPDGQTFASCGADSTVKIWDVPLGKPLRDLAMTESVTATAVSADGKSVAAGAKDGSIKIWNAADAKESFRLTGHVGAVNGLAYAAGAPLLASCGVDGTLRFWNPATGQVVAVVGAHATPVHALALSANAAFTAAADGSVKVWQLPPVTSKPLAGHQDTVRALALSADGAKVVTGGADKNVRVFNTESGQLQTTLIAPNAVTAVGLSGAGNTSTTAAGTSTGQLILWGPDGKPAFQTQAHSGAVTSVAYSPNGAQLLTSGADGNVNTWALPIIPTKSFAHPADVRVALISADGKRILTGASDNQMRLWNPVTGQVERPFAGHTKPVSAVAMSPDGNTLASASGDDVRVWRRDNGQQTGQLTGQAGVSAIAIHPGGAQLLAAHEDGSLKLWPLPIPMKDAKPVWTAKAPAAVKNVQFDPKGERFLSIGKDAQLRLWDAKTGKEAKAIPAHEGEILDVAATADWAKIATSGADKSVKVWNVADGKPLTTVGLSAPAVRIAVSPNGNRLAVALGSGKGFQVAVHDVATSKVLMSLDENYPAVASLVFAPDNRGVTIVADKTVAIVDVPVLSSFTAHAGGVGSAVYLGNGTQAFAGGRDKAVKSWDLATGKEAKSFGTLADPVNAVAASRDSVQLAAAAGKAVKIWSAADGKELATLPHPAEVIAVAFSADRTRLVTGTTDNLARVWDISPIAQGKPSVELQSFGHGAAIHAVAFHPGKPNVVITASADKTAAVHTMTIQRTIAASTMPVRALALAPSGQLLTAGDDKTAKAITPGSEAAAKPFAGATAALNAVAISKNGGLLATAGADKIVRIYNPNDATLLGSFPTVGVVRSLSFHPNNQVLLSGGDDKTLTAWNVVLQPGNPPPPEFGKPVQSFPHAAAVHSATYSADGATLISGGDDKSAHVWKVAAEGPTKNFQHPNIVDALAYNKEGNQLATGCHDGSVRIWDVVKGATVKQITAHVQTQPQAQQFPVYAVAWSPDNKQVASGSLDKSIKIWDAVAGTLVREIKGYDEKAAPSGHRDGVFTLAYSPDGQWIVSGSSDRSIKVWKAADGTLVREFVNPNFPASAGQPAAAHPGWVYQLRYTPDGKNVVSVGGAPRNKGYVAAWNPADGKLLGAMELPLGPFYGVAASPDGAALGIACGPRGRMNPQAEAVWIKTPGR